MGSSRSAASDNRDKALLALRRAGGDARQCDVVSGAELHGLSRHVPAVLGQDDGERAFSAPGAASTPDQYRLEKRRLSLGRFRSATALANTGFPRNLAKSQFLR
jgi:hypothetical protein